MPHSLQSMRHTLQSMAHFLHSLYAGKTGGCDHAARRKRAARLAASVKLMEGFADALSYKLPKFEF